MEGIEMEREEITTTDMAKMGSRERGMMRELLNAWNEQGLPEDFEADEVVVMFNMNSGSVFLTNSEYQAAMMNGDKLETWYNCPYCGHEGFKEDMKHKPEAKDCTEYLEQLGVIEATTKAA
jgi:hypothetical protein